MREGICPAVVGPTAVGKTGLVIALAERLPIEVISLDSRQIYYGLRIGTAQPTPEEQAVCPHHLVDFVSPESKYDAIRFRADFERVYKEITGRGGVPLLVGGAGMYLTALREGFMDIPGHSPEKLAEVRVALEPLADEAIRDRLKTVDPTSWERIHANDRYRSQRALEIFDISGHTMTELSDTQTAAPSLGLDFPTFVLERPVAELDARIARRTLAMLQGRWVQETMAAMAVHSSGCPGLMSIGYREIVGWLERQIDEDDLLPSIVRVTRQYAKRQRTLFRHIPKVWSGSPDDEALPDLLLSHLQGDARS